MIRDDYNTNKHIHGVYASAANSWSWLKFVCRFTLFGVIFEIGGVLGSSIISQTPEKNVICVSFLFYFLFGEIGERPELLSR